MAQTVTFNGVSYSIPEAREVGWSSLTNFLVALGTYTQTNVIQKSALRVAVATPITVAAATDYCVVSNLTVAGAVAVNLPAGVAGQIFAIVDGKYDAATNNITITPNGSDKIMAVSSLVLSSNGEGVILQYNSTNTNWHILGNFKSNYLTTTGTQVVTNKDIDGGTASNTSRLTVPKAAKSVLDALTRKEATLVYATDLAQYFEDNGSALVPIGSTTSTGELNLVSNPSAAVDITGWVASAAGITVAKTTTANELPLGSIISSAIKITPVSSTDYVRYRFTMAEALKNTKLKIQWNQRALSGYASGDVKLQLYKNSASDYSGSYTQFVLSTDSSSVSAVPALSGRYTSTVDTDSGDYYELRIVRVAGTSAITLANVVVGPGIQPQGAVVSDWQSYTATFTNFTASSQSLYYRRVGSNMEIRGEFTISGSSGAEARLSLPSPYTVGNTPASNSQIVGYVEQNNANSTNSARLLAVAGNAYLNFGTFDITTAANPLTLANASTALNSVRTSMHASLPIADWTNNGVVNLAQNDVEYTSNFSTSTSAADTTSFANGPAGSQIQNITAALSRRVRWPTPIQPTDQFAVQVSEDQVIWLDADHWNLDSGVTDNICPWVQQNTTNYGIGRCNKINSTDMDIYFGTYAWPSGTTYASAGTAWSTFWGAKFWRVKKIKAGSTVGFGIVSQNASGLVPSSNANLDDPSATRLGLKEYAHGTTYNGGIAPTITLTAGGGSLSSIPYSGFTPKQMQDGSWQCHVMFIALVSSTSRTSATFTINGLVFKNANDQSAPGYSDDGRLINSVKAQSNASTVVFKHDSGTSTYYSLTATLKCESKPTWAY